jgi:hypothetical protein
MAVAACHREEQPYMNDVECSLVSACYAHVDSLSHTHIIVFNKSTQITFFMTMSKSMFQLPDLKLFCRNSVHSTALDGSPHRSPSSHSLIDLYHRILPSFFLIASSHPASMPHSAYAHARRCRRGMLTLLPDLAAVRHNQSRAHGNLAQQTPGIINWAVNSRPADKPDLTRKAATIEPHDGIRWAYSLDLFEP